MSILTVGKGKQYASIAAALGASNDGDIVRVDAGTYTNDTAIIRKSVTLQAIGGRVVMQTTTPIANGKGILVAGTINDAPVVRIIGFDFTGATVGDGNGAGVRWQNGDLVCTSCYFHHCQNGLLATANYAHSGSVLLDRCEFAFCGTGDGYTHNIYVTQAASFALTNSYSHDCASGHLVKSRADANFISSNRLFQNASTSSYCIDLPNAGNAIVTRNQIQHSAQAQNKHLLTYGVEVGQTQNAGRSYLIASNTIISDAPNCTVVFNKSSSAVTFSDNALWGVPQTAAGLSNGVTIPFGTGYLTARPPLDTTSHPYADTFPVPADGDGVQSTYCDDGEIQTQEA